MLIDRILGRLVAAVFMATQARFVAVGALALLLLSVLPSRRAQAFCRTTTCADKMPPAQCRRDNDGCWTSGIPLSWEQQCVSLSVSALGSPRLGLDYATAESVVKTAFGLWLTARCSDGLPSISVASRGPLMCERREYNPSGPNANAVLFRDEEWTRDPSIIAVTTVSFNASSGRILNADLEINSFVYDNLGLAELEFVIGHEAGHFLGLDHSPDPTALMFYRDSFDGSTEPELSPDDLAGLCEIYPPTRSVPACNYEPANGFATDCGGDVTAGCAVVPRPPSAWRATLGAALALLALLALAGSGRRRRAHPRRTRPGGAALPVTSPSGRSPIDSS